MVFYGDEKLQRQYKERQSEKKRAGHVTIEVEKKSPQKDSCRLKYRMTLNTMNVQL